MEISSFSLKWKLTASFFLVTAVTVSLTTLVFTQTVKKSIIERADRQLESVKALKKAKILNFLDELKKDIHFLTANVLLDNFEPNSNKIFERYAAILKDSRIRDYMLDVFIVQENRVVFSLSGKNHLPDKIQKNLMNEEKYLSFVEDQDPSLELYPLCLWLVEKIKLKKTKKSYLFKKLLPKFKHCKGSLDPGLRSEECAHPLVQIVQFSSKKINDILLQRSGLGDTGESYLVGSRDQFLRTHSRFFQPNRSVFKLQIDTTPFRYALTRGSGSVIADDYRGEKVLSSYDRIRLDDLDWVLLSEIDLAEVLKPMSQVYGQFITIALVGFLLAFFASSWIVRKISEQEQIHISLKRTIQYKVQEEERTRVSMELHDGVGQLLAAVLLKVESYNMKAEAKVQLKELVREIMSEIRKISNNLMPRVLVSFGLLAAIKELCAEFNKTSGVKFYFGTDMTSEELNLPIDTQKSVFRITQEAIHNIIKHSFATECVVSLLGNKEGKPQLELTVEDNGVGFLIGKERERLKKGNSGLWNMRERAESLGGKFKIFSVPHGGTRLVVKVPLANRDV